MRFPSSALCSLAIVVLFAGCGEQSALTAASSAPVPVFPSGAPKPSASRAARTALMSADIPRPVGTVVYSFDELPEDCNWDREPVTFHDLTFSGSIATCQSFLAGGGIALIPANSAGGAYNQLNRYTNEVILPMKATEVSVSYYTFGYSPNHLVAYGPDGVEIDRASDEGAETGVMTVRGDIRSIAFEAYQVSVYYDNLVVKYAVSDSTPPVIVPTITGTLGADGWYTDDATVSWTVTDLESPISSAPCAPTVISAQTAGTFVSCTAVSVGGPATVTTTVKLDRTAPVITPSIAGPLGTNGWYTGNAMITWDTSDDVSGATACRSDILATDGPARFSCTSTNGAGLATTLGVDIKRDATAPVVTYTGATSYTVDQSVGIRCGATDAMSGVVSSTCAPITGDAYTFLLGGNTRSAVATDAAGNIGSGSVTFTVSVTPASLIALVQRWVTGNGVQSTMIKKIEAGNYDSFRTSVEAQTGKAVSATHAEILTRLSYSL